MKRALLFPGQASQYVGMGRDLAESYPVAREMFSQADQILGFKLSEKCFEGPLSELTQTKITQPAIYTVSAIIAALLMREKGLIFSAAAGHSLGEYSALYATGTFSFETGLELVKVRAESMQLASEERHGTMAAILNLDEEKVQEACNKASGYGIVQIANINNSKQIAISGETEAVQIAMKYAKDLGAARAIQLEVGGAFHSPLMAIASPILEKKLKAMILTIPSYPVYSNVDALPTKSLEKISRNLIQQIEKPVLWTKSIQNMIQDGYNQFIEIGPGKVLQGLVKRIDENVDVSGISTSEDIERFIDEA